VPTARWSSQELGKIGDTIIGKHTSGLAQRGQLAITCPRPNTFLKKATVVIRARVEASASGVTLTLNGARKSRG
jgi:hypothetical protein